MVLGVWQPSSEGLLSWGFPRSLKNGIILLRFYPLIIQVRQPKSCYWLPSLKLTACPWKSMVGRWKSFWEDLFSCQGVDVFIPPGVFEGPSGQAVQCKCRRRVWDGCWVWHLSAGAFCSLEVPWKPYPNKSSCLMVMILKGSDEQCQKGPLVGCLGCKTDEKLPSYIKIIKINYKDSRIPIKQSGFNGK